MSLTPLGQIVDSTQHYVRDAVIEYVTAMGTVSPAIEVVSCSAARRIRSSRSHRRPRPGTSTLSS